MECHVLPPLSHWVTNYEIQIDKYMKYTPLQKKCNAWLRGSHAPKKGPVAPGGSAIVSRVSLEDFA